MRVGIHTGAILAGVLGQRQWQFDIYSRDVELANKMESSGAAGRVHISETTLGFLNGNFEVEPAYGEKREEALRLAGLRTYFITRALVPWEGQDDDGGEEKSRDDDGVPTGDERDFDSRLREELTSRDAHGDLAKQTRAVTIAFTSPEAEAAYHQHAESFSSVTLQAFLVVRLAIGLAQFLVLPRRMMNLASFAVGNFLLMIISTVSLADVLPAQMCPSPLINFFRWINR